MSQIRNFIVFQIGWIVCVLGGAQQRPYLASAFALGLILWHWARERFARGELMLIVSAGVLGALVDTALVRAQLVEFPSGQWLPGVAPVWIITMWMLFATTLNHSLAWLKGKAWLGALAGAIGGPSAYYAGEALGGVSFPDRTTALTTLAVLWAVVTPALLGWAQHLNRDDLARDQWTVAR